MSLIYFHIFLISVAVLFSFGVGFWGFDSYASSQAAADLWTGIGSIVFAFLLICYLFVFLKRIRKRE